MNTKLAVLTTKPTLLDFSVVEKGIKARSSDEINRGPAFVQYVVETVFHIPPEDAALHIVDGGQDRGVDIVYIDHENQMINICSCKAVAHFKKSHRCFPGDEIDKIVSFVDDLLFRREELLESVNGALAAKVREIWEIFADDPYPIKVRLFSNQLPLADSERARLVSSLARHKIELLEHGLYELAHGAVRATRPKFRKRILPVKGDAFSVVEANRKGIVTRVALKELYDFVCDENGSFDERLIEQNVRYFLGHDNDVNREIRATLIGGNASDFWFLNNGLTIVCDQVIAVENGCHPLTLVNPQIVNGGQTAHVVHHVGAETLIALNEGSLPIKIIQTSDTDFIERVALASNTQSRIFGRDLRANDHIQTRLASSISDHGYFYRRKRGEKGPFGLKIIDALRAGQLILAFICAEPTKSKTNSNDIFGDLYSLAFDPNVITAELVITASKIHEEIQAIRQQALAWQSSISRNSFAETWIIEGHLHLLFVIGELMRRKAIPYGSVDEAINLIPDAIAVVAQYVADHPRVSAYRLFRLVSSKEELLEIIDGFGRPSPAQPHQLSLGL
ncbi:AIPR family protein [Microvirga sp. VF16]|uniref:AIPR family protein n=1 Tax=Microvirga sp. VF16 TaxID=2807101 RepID=UPI00193DC7DF|nr:AIPR family protein [Microvirga sp. VF16]QRM31343.1 AIPR family protein [Microvirga sp. VF16]